MATHLDQEANAPQKSREVSADQLDVLVYAPFRTYFDGLADSVTAKNGKGVFDILPQHHKFITLLDAGYVTIKSNFGEQKIIIEKGLMHVNNNKVTVFLDV